MKRSEIILAGGLLAVALVWLTGPSLLDLMSGSGRRLESRKTVLKRELVQLGKLNRWKHQSLAAPESATADRAEEQYRNWVWSLAESVGKFKELNVTPSSRGGRRRGRGYVPVQVQLIGTARFADVKRFLFHFYQADLLHRVVSLRLRSKVQDEDPQLEVLLVAEGLSLDYAAGERAGRDSLFPQTRLANETTDGTLDVTEPEEFPAKADFLVRIGDQYLNVTGVDKDSAGGSGTSDEFGVQRWITKSEVFEQRLAADSIVELVRVADSMQTITLDDYNLVNLFARYEARLILSGSKMITVGEAFSLTARVEGSRPGIGKTFELGAHPEGMTIDGRTGKIAWQTSKDQSPGRASVEVFAKLDGSETRLSGSPTTVEWKAIAVARNRPPTLNGLQPITVVAGTAVEFTVAGMDPERGTLAFALADGAPGGATIDAASGRFRWVPQDAGDFQVTVEVRDDGTPPQKVTGRVAITVSLDSAQFTVLIGSIVRDDVSEAWFFDRLKNQRIVLRNKSRFRYGDVDAEVVSIEDRAVVFRIGKEERRLVLGDSLQELRSRAKKPDDGSR
jgi:hypothetical protein